MSDGTLGFVVTDVATAVGIGGAIAFAAAMLDKYARRTSSRRRIRRLMGHFRDKKLIFFTNPPFTVVSDEEEDDVKARLDQIVPSVTESLAAVGLTHNPSPDITLCLFDEWKTYEDCSTWLAGRKQNWRGGNFMARCNTVVVYLSGGNEVLVHEMAHAFVHANISYCPVWLNEGLACLVTGCSEDNAFVQPDRDHAVWETVSAIRENRALPLEKLCALTFSAFHNDDGVRNYAQATCLCYYLQEHELLNEYCRAYRSGRRRDPTGYSTLKRVLGRQDMQEFQQEWESFVLSSYYG